MVYAERVTVVHQSYHTELRFLTSGDTIVFKLEVWFCFYVFHVSSLVCFIIKCIGEKGARWNMDSCWVEGNHSTKTTFSLHQKRKLPGKSWNSSILQPRLSDTLGTQEAHYHTDSPALAQHAQGPGFHPQYHKKEKDEQETYFKGYWPALPSVYLKGVGAA